MNEELKFETYLLIDRKKIVICVLKKRTFEVIFKEEKLLDDHNEDSKLKILESDLILFPARIQHKIEILTENYYYNAQQLKIIFQDIFYQKIHLIRFPCQIIILFME